MNTRRMVATALVAVASLSLTACGDKSYTPLTTATDFAKAVSKAAKDLQSVRMVSKASSFVTSEATFSFRAPVAMQMVQSTTIDGRKSTATIRVVGDAIYIQASATGKWAKISSTTGQTSEQVKKNGPAGIADQFEKGVKSIKYVGATKIDGQTVQHYTLVMDTSQLGSSFEALSATAAGLHGLTTFSEQVFVTDQNVLRRISFTLPAPVGTEQIDFTNWNAPVSIKAPAAADIVSGS